jgi:multidrug efflux pump subunit AcrA (membrane-fusion protein)
MATLEAAIDTAQALVSGASALQTQVDAEVTTLDTAITAFNGAKGTGTGGAQPDRTALNSVITSATAVKTGVVTAVTAGGLTAGTEWVTPAVMGALEVAIDDAQAVATDASATQAQIDAARTTLNTAITAFNAEKQTASGGGGDGDSGTTVDGIEWSQDDGVITITGYTGTSTDVVIPASINGKPVTSIGDMAFEDNQLTGVTIPNSVTSIGDMAFEDNQLTSVTIGSSVTSIGMRAFGNNPLVSVIIPGSVTVIDSRAFAGYGPLTSITIGADVTLEDSAFSGDFKTVYDGNGKQAGTYTSDDSYQWTKQ